MLVGDPAYAENELRPDLWRAGHAHAGVSLVLSLVALRYEGLDGSGSDSFTRGQLGVEAPDA